MAFSILGNNTCKGTRFKNFYTSLNLLFPPSTFVVHEQNPVYPWFSQFWCSTCEVFSCVKILHIYIVKQHVLEMRMNYSMQYIFWYSLVFIKWLIEAIAWTIQEMVEFGLVWKYSQHIWNICISPNILTCIRNNYRKSF